jgi:tRNA-specific 2-thiouridylase
MDKILCAISGGVDSAMAAYITKYYTLDPVHGIYMGLWGGEANDKSCSTADAEAARAVAEELGIPLAELDFTDAFSYRIVDHTRSEMTEGRMPSPCVDCNKLFKVDALIAYAKAKGYTKIVTGHYAINAAGVLKRHPSSNDQSYFLWKMSPDDLKWFEFPLANCHDKANVRHGARQLGLHVADKPDSTNLCFDSKGLCASAPAVSVVGRGVAPGTTVQPGELALGQRKGLPADSVDAEPSYVTDVTASQITIGRKEALFVKEQAVTDVVWYKEPMNGRAWVKCSSQSPLERVFVYSNNERIRFSDEERRRVAPGQDIVFYNNADEVIGGCHAA